MEVHNKTEGWEILRSGYSEKALLCIEGEDYTDYQVNGVDKMEKEVKNETTIVTSPNIHKMGGGYGDND